MAHSTTSINNAIGNIQTLHGRFANEYCNSLKRYLGNKPLLDNLTSVNKTVGFIIDRLYDYEPYGITSVNDELNNLTEEEVQTLIDWCYRILNKYMNQIFIPTNPNVYL
jgi:hypothetical protein